MPTTLPKETREERYNNALTEVQKRCAEADQNNTCRNKVIPYSEAMILTNIESILLPFNFARRETITSLRELFRDTRILTTIL